MNRLATVNELCRLVGAEREHPDHQYLSKRELRRVLEVVRKVPRLGVDVCAKCLKPMPKDSNCTWCDACVLVDYNRGMDAKQR